MDGIELGSVMPCILSPTGVIDEPKDALPVEEANESIASSVQG